MEELLVAARKALRLHCHRDCACHVGRGRENDRAFHRSVRIRGRVGANQAQSCPGCAFWAEIIRERVTGIVLNKADPSSLRTMEAYKGDKFRDYYQE